MIVTETDELQADSASKLLRSVMEQNDDWDAGLPLASEIAESWYYSKAVKGH